MTEAHHAWFVLNFSFLCFEFVSNFVLRISDLGELSLLQPSHYTPPMHILLTNDDGIYSPGLEALRDALLRLGTVDVISPAVEQSGVSHSITYLDPLIVNDIYRNGQLYGRAVHGSPADCVKLGMMEYCKTPPDLVVSGINSGLNIGINVMYSGTVAGAIEGAFFGVTSVAVSLAESRQPDYPRAAQLAVQLIEQLLAQNVDKGSLWNINFPELKSGWPLGVKTMPMGTGQYREIMERRIDPRGRAYFWCGTDPRGGHPHQPDTDVEAIAEGYATITPLHFNLTHTQRLNKFAGHAWRLE
jgi:5'-nucleotidase